MRGRLFLGILVTSIFFLSCKEAPVEEKRRDPVLEKIAGKDYAKLIQIPTTPEGQVDTNQMARIQFEETTFDFDTLLPGDRVTHDFIFQNTGVRDLYILETNSSCGCTVTEYAKEPVPPGGTGKIQVAFNSAGKKGEQNRKISIITNAFPSERVLRMTGYVKLNE